MSAPARMKGRKPVKIPLHSVIDILSEIESLNHTEDFKKAAKKHKAFVTVHPETVNFVKDYLHANELHTQSAVAKKIVGACPGPDPYRCPYSQSD